ncbi:aminoglycoside phosphotransferase family protein [Streptomyces sp. NBC_01450]|uniref:phosphotransferase family protein n=1 Tax=Streptomyces sp. NBC_01450 TaxID=2903871 RepID=UPI002E378ED3|nr:aminoglycoside phosphotransferase family protein [Streptomyces sp. NBC_01450]
MVDALDDAVPLPGGRITKKVVRIADTVRRPASAASPFVADLLGLLEKRGFTGAPRCLGRDDVGRDIFSYVPGWVPPRFQQWTDTQVAAAGALVRDMHDATRGSLLAGRHQVVCHNDLGPNNTVFQDGHPVAFIDFDTAAPGSPLEDLGYMAWVWCVSSKAEAPPVEVQAAQVRVLVDAYGLGGPEREVLVDAMLERQSRNARFWAEVQADPGDVEVSREQVAERIAWSRREHAHTVGNRRVFESALS